MIPIKKIYSISLLSFDTKTKHHLQRPPHHILYFVESGSISLITSNDKFLLQSNQCVVMPDNTDHYLHVSSNWNTKVIIISFTIYSEEKSLLTVFNQVVHFSEEQKEIVHRIISRARLVYHQLSKNIFDTRQKINDADPTNERIIYLDFAEALLMLEQNCLEKEKQAEENAFTVYKTDTVNRILDYMKAHLSDNYTVKDFASHFYISPSYIKKIFKEHTGHSIISFYKTLKMEKAKEYIQNGDRTFTDIGITLGYESIHHFSNAFKKYTGLSPTKYKKYIKESRKQTS